MFHFCNIRINSTEPFCFLTSDNKIIFHLLMSDLWKNLMQRSHAVPLEMLYSLPIIDKNIYKQIHKFCKIERMHSEKNFTKFYTACEDLVKKQKEQFCYSILIFSSEEDCLKAMQQIRNKCKDSKNARNPYCIVSQNKVNKFSSQKKKIFEAIKNRDDNIFFLLVNGKHCIIILNKEEEIVLSKDSLKDLYNKYFIESIVTSGHIDDLAEQFLVFLYSDILYF